MKGRGRDRERDREREEMERGEEMIDTSSVSAVLYSWPFL